MIISGMELCIPHTLSNIEAKMPWFNFAWSCAVNDKEADRKRYHSHPSAETNALYISARNHAKSIFTLTKILSSIENVKIFTILTLLVMAGI